MSAALAKKIVELARQMSPMPGGILLGMAIGLLNDAGLDRRAIRSLVERAFEKDNVPENPPRDG